MKMDKKCISCLFDQIARVSNVLKYDNSVAYEISKALAGRFDKISMNQTPAYNGRIVYQTISEVTGIKDI